MIPSFFFDCFRSSQYKAFGTSQQRFASSVGSTTLWLSKIWCLLISYETAICLSPLWASPTANGIDLIIVAVTGNEKADDTLFCLSLLGYERLIFSMTRHRRHCWCYLGPLRKQFRCDFRCGAGLQGHLRSKKSGTHGSSDLPMSQLGIFGKRRVCRRVVFKSVVLHIQDKLSTSNFEFAVVE